MFLLDGIVPALLLALIIDRLIGEPAWLYRHLPHPVVVIGKLISRLERRFLDEAVSPAERVLQGGRLTLILIALTTAFGLFVQWLCLQLPFGWVILAILMSTLIAQASLAEHVQAVAGGLRRSLADGRAAVAMIVGRDPEQLDQPAVARAAIESLAENFSDAVVAPVFYAFLFGLPGILVYKAINTADSMIGHKSARYLHFGRFAAKLDDVVNWLPARLSALIVTAAACMIPSTSPAAAWRTTLRDADRHRSPNGGWPEAAMAGALDIRLSGPRSYHGETTDDVWIGSGKSAMDAADIERAVGLFWRSCLVLTVCLVPGLLL